MLKSMHKWLSLVLIFATSFLDGCYHPPEFDHIAAVKTPDNGW